MSRFQVYGVEPEDNGILGRQLVERRYVLTFLQKLSPYLFEAYTSPHHR
jgi:hypothetical protein